MFLQTICTVQLVTVCDGPFAAKDRKLKRNNDKKKYIKRERVEIPYELKDESLGGG